MNSPFESDRQHVMQACEHFSGILIQILIFLSAMLTLSLRRLCFFLHFSPVSIQKDDSEYSISSRKFIWHSWYLVT